MHGLPTNALITDHLWIVRRFVARYQASAPRADLLAAGSLGLVEAAQRFDPTRGLQFSTYAWNWVKGAVLSELRRCHVVAVPDHTARKAAALGEPVTDVCVFVGCGDGPGKHGGGGGYLRGTNGALEPQQEHAACKSMRLRDLHHAIERLDNPAHRHVIGRTLSGRTPEQIAKGMELSTMRVRQLLEEAQTLLAEDVTGG